MSGKIKRILLLGWLGTAWLFLIAPLVADWLWADSRTVSAVGAVLIIGLGGGVLFFGRQILLGARIVVLSLVSILRDRRKTRTVLLLAVAVFLLVHLQDIPWWLDDLKVGLEDTVWALGDWITPILWGEGWERLALVALGLVAMVWLVRGLGGPKQAQQTLKSVPKILALLGFSKWWAMETTYKIGTAVLTVLALIKLFSGKTLDMAAVLVVLLIVAYRGWPRRNPLDPPPVVPFDLPVMRGFRRLEFLIAGAGCFFILLIGAITAFASGMLYPFALGIIASQAFFAWYVGKRPGLSQAWLTIRVLPKTKQIVFDRAFGMTGEISLIPLKLGPVRMKERKGILDNFLRIFGFYLFEFEPVGVKKEAGEQETFEVYLQAGHFRFKMEGRTFKGPRALLMWIASLK